MSTGSRIKEIRKKAKLTQDELAKKVGISKNGLWNYENDKREISIELIHKIADTLEVPISEIVEEENPYRKLDKKVKDIKLVLLEAYRDLNEKEDIIDSLVQDLVEDPTNKELKNKLYEYNYQHNSLTGYINDIESDLIDLEKQLKSYLDSASKYSESGESLLDEKEIEQGKKVLEEIKSIGDEQKQRELLAFYNKLNNSGKSEAIKRVRELSQLKAYTRDEKFSFTVNYDEA